MSLVKKKKKKRWKWSNNRAKLSIFPRLIMFNFTVFCYLFIRYSYALVSIFVLAVTVYFNVYKLILQDCKIFSLSTNSSPRNSLCVLTKIKYYFTENCVKYVKRSVFACFHLDLNRRTHVYDDRADWTIAGTIKYTNEPSGIYLKVVATRVGHNETILFW